VAHWCTTAAATGEAAGLVETSLGQAKQQEGVFAAHWDTQLPPAAAAAAIAVTAALGVCTSKRAEVQAKG